MNSANYDEVANMPTVVGTNGGPSSYGTYDQNGNIYEWTEGTGPVIEINNTKLQTVWARGGRFVGRNGDLGLRSDYLHYFQPELSHAGVGFRICSHGSSNIVENGRTLPNSLADPQKFSPFVLVGDPGNMPDSLDPIIKNGILEQNPISIGSVDYEYRIQRCPTTVSEYCQFLNAVASREDTYNLYSQGMSEGNFANIEVYSYSGVTSYRPKAGKANTPATRISWYNAARFCNWLSNGCPNGQQTPETTEDGAYSINGLVNENVVNINRNTINPNTGLSPTYWLPSPSEWHKAAYYKGRGIDSGYWTFATQSDEPPLKTTVDKNQNGVMAAPLPSHTHDFRDITGGVSTSITLNDKDGKPVMLTFWEGTLAGITRG